jgi:hypothetical protein
MLRRALCKQNPLFDRQRRVAAKRARSALCECAIRVLKMNIRGERNARKSRWSGN